MCELTARVAFWLGAHTATPLLPPPGRYLSVPQCAAHIGRTEGAVYRLVERREIPYLKVGRRLQFDVEKVDRWMERHARKGKTVG